MKYLLTILFVLLLSFPTLVAAEVWRVTWGSISATTQGQAPTSYYNSMQGSNSAGIPIADHTKSIQATCFTVGANATDADFNFLYDKQTANAHVLCDDIGEASNCSYGITVGGDYLKFTADNDDAADAVTPYCDVVLKIFK